jgi:hypothetical protein
MPSLLRRSSCGDNLFSVVMQVVDNDHGKYCSQMLDWLKMHHGNVENVFKLFIAEKFR